MIDAVVGEPAPTPRILVVEDEFLLAAGLADELTAAGYVVVGPYSRLQDARLGAEREQFDLALLDINVRQELVYPLADELCAHDVPFIFLSGYSASDVPLRFRERPRLAKPYEARSLLALVARCLAEINPSPAGAC